MTKSVTVHGIQLMNSLESPIITFHGIPYSLNARNSYHTCLLSWKTFKYFLTSEIIANAFVRNYVRVSFIMARVLFYYMFRPTWAIFRYLV
jgi:hypothetical protein